MINKNVVTAAFLSFTLIACSENGGINSQRIEPTAPVPKAAANEEVLSRISSLGSVTLSPDSCGLFLWSRVGSERILVTVLQNDVPGALIRLDGETQRLRQTLTEGRAFYGIFEKTYLTGVDVKAELTLSAASVAALPQGATIKRASLSLTDDTGYTLSLPLAGLIACQTGSLAEG